MHSTNLPLRASRPPGSNSEMPPGPAAGISASSKPSPKSLLREPVEWRTIELAPLRAFLESGTIPSSYSFYRDDRKKIVAWCVMHGEADVLRQFLLQGNMRELRIANTNLSEKSVQCLAEILTMDTPVTSLFLECCSFPADGGQLIADALKMNQTLTSLVCHCLPPHGVGAIAEALKFNRTLTSLDIGENRLCAEDADAIADMLNWNDTLTTLGLYHVGLDAYGIAAIAAALSANTVLSTLQIGGNDIDPEGVRVLTGALEKNKTLTHIAVSYNASFYESNIELDPEPFMALLKTNSTLTSVNLEGNTYQLDQAGIAAVARNKQFAQSRAGLVSAGRGFAASLPLELPVEIGEQIGRLLVQDVAGCRAAVALTGLNKACRAEATDAVINADPRLPGLRQQ